MSAGQDSRILQIIPAEGWFAAFNDMDTGEQVYAPLVCWALRADNGAQVITGMVIAEKQIVPCTGDASFSHYLHRAELDIAEQDEE